MNIFEPVFASGSGVLYANYSTHWQYFILFNGLGVIMLIYTFVSAFGFIKKGIKEELKWVIKMIDLFGCELTQNITKKLKEK